MGEVGTNSSDNPNVELKMNGMNGNCEDEPMDVDSQDDLQVSTEISAKKVAQLEVNKNNSDSIKNDNNSDILSKEKEDGYFEAISDSENEDFDSDSQHSADLSKTNTTQENGNTAKESDSVKEPIKNNNNNNNNNSDPDDNSQSNATKKEELTTEASAATNKPQQNTDQNVSRQSNDNLDDNENDTNKSDDIEMVEIKTKDVSTEENSNGLDKEDATKTSNGNTTNDDKDKWIPPVEEVHAISDSDDDEDDNDVPKIGNEENPLREADEAMEVDGKTSNGVLNDDDKPVSIHSDSDVENESSNSKPNNVEDEIHEILSDKEEDCVVIEDDKRADDDQLSPRRSARARKSVVTVRDFSAFDDDIEEIIEDPLQQPPAKKLKTNLTTSVPQQITIQDARSLAADPLGTVRGPTASTVQALQKQNVSVVPVGVSNQEAYPANLRTGTNQIIPNVNNKNIAPALAGLPSLINAPLLSALTDDMFVLEAPSFIVPYIYEKPPTTDLKEIVSTMGTELEEQRKNDGIKEEKEENSEDELLKLEAKETKDGEDDEKKEEQETKKDNKKKKRPSRKNADDSWDESDTSTDDEASDNEERTKVLIKEVKEDLETIKTHIINRDPIKDDIMKSDQNKDANNYFESPLGKYFMDIGINLVQEHVQTDLLRQQKRKLNREGVQASPSIQVAINSLMKNLELSKGKNDVFKFETKRCEYCNFKSESSLVMAHHYETPHMKGNLYKCNFCSFEIRTAYDILFHMKNVHNIQARLEKAASLHQCPNCLFEDNGRSKLARHALVCSKKFRPEVNLSPPVDWEPPAKIPRVKPRHGLVGTANAYQAMAAQAQRAATAAALQKQNAAAAAAANAALIRNRGRQQQPITKPQPMGSVLKPNQPMRPQMAGGMVLPNNFQFTNSGQFIQVPGAGIAMLPNAQNSLIMQPASSSKTTKNSQQPSISITALPRQHSGNVGSNSLSQGAGGLLSKPPGAGNMKPGQGPQSGKASFVICEICDGYIKDLDQLRNHMQWMHKVKIHPKMIYNRPPLNCQKCQFRFFTDQGLERHLLGSHGLVTSSMQEAANKGKDAGRCPVCGRMYQWKLLNHVSREHNMTLKPAHLSYKCTVCTATFGMYKQFENHVYSAHSTVAKKAMDNKKNSSAGGVGNSSSSGSSSSGTTLSKLASGLAGASLLPNAGDSLLKPLKINDEITIIPQPASRNNRTIDLESHVID